MKHNNVKNIKKIALAVMLLSSLNANAQSNAVANTDKRSGGVVEKIALLTLVFGTAGAFLYAQSKDADAEMLKKSKENQR